MDRGKQLGTALDPRKRLCPVAEAADYLSLSRSKLYEMMDAGELAYVKIGRSRRIAIEAIEALIETHRIGR